MRIFSIRNLFLLLLTVVPNLLQLKAEEDFRFHPLDMDDGLFNNQVRLMAEMPDHRILVYTEGMFNLYNGHNFEPLTCDLRLTFPLDIHNNCRTYATNDGLLWAKDFYRLYLLDAHTYRFLPDIRERLAPAQVKEALNDFIIDNDQNAWLITQSGKLYRFDWQHPAQLIHTPTVEESQLRLRVTDVIQAGNFHLIFLNNGRMFCWDGKTGQIVATDRSIERSEPSPYFRISSLALDNRRLLVAVSSSSGRLWLYDMYDHSWTNILNDRIINDMRRDAEGRIWLGCNRSIIWLSDSLQVLKEHAYYPLDKGNNISDNVMNVLMDSNRNIWLGLGSSGVLQYKPNDRLINAFANNAGNSSESKLIRSMLPYDDHNLLIGTLDGVFLFDTSSHTYRYLHPALKHVFCSDIKRDAKGIFWLSTRQGLIALDKGEPTFHTQSPNGLPSAVVRFALPTSDGRLLVCNELRNLGLFDPEEGTFESFNNEIPGLNIFRALSCAIEDHKDGTFIVGSQSGIFRLDPHKRSLSPITRLQPMEAFSSKYNCLLTDSKGVIWIGTQNGLIAYTPETNTVKRYTTDDGLPNNCIQGVVENDECIWVSTSNGLARIMRMASNHSAVMKFDKSDGIPEGEMMEQSIAVLPNGHIYSGSVQGITEVCPKQIGNHLKPLKPLMVGLTVMDRNIRNDGEYNGRLLLPQGLSYTTELLLDYNENFIEFQFSALNYDMPQHTHYRYHLEGVDQEKWNYSSPGNGLCTATYTALEPGNYRLVAQATMGNAPWGDELVWHITIRPPLWRTWWAYLLYAAVFLGLLYYIIDLYISYRRSRMVMEQETIKRLREQHLDQLKFRFFTNISHEFRTPLTLIITPLEVLLKRTQGDARLHKELQQILHSAQDLLRLVNRLLDFRRLEQQGEHLNPEPVYIKSFIEENVHHFNGLAQEKNLTLVCDCSLAEDELFYLDNEKMTRVLNNLLSNAFKFTPTGGIISVHAYWNITSGNTPESLCIAVSDTGVGIAKEDLKSIFERFYQSTSAGGSSSQLNTGSGIGLHLTKGYVELHGGNIIVESTPEKGSTFIVTLPIRDQQANEQPSVTETVALDTGTETDGITSYNNTSEQIPEVPEEDVVRKDITVLIAEDNQQFRKFLKDTLESSYNIITATDGVEGLDMARHHNPDLIVSDLMMPRMDGLRFCKLIKMDVKYSHIPIILLTAKNSSESRATCYEAGADSFIAKPFNMEVLLARIRQLIEQRERRKVLFRNELNVDPKEITVSSLDQQLIEKAMQCIEKNMDNTDYTVESLSADVGIDRTYLYRKMQAIVGQTPSEFMRSVRLKRAARLLETSQLPVQQISWMVGFNTPRYFSSYFKEMFGVTPSQYAQMKQRADKRKK